ncbi:hypothetical protein ACFY5F_36280 [Streptomyces sp. NPDC013161]|uniref:hypothetical protein n=1 Tax=Streptomyces sp. NPDC013161 TaxID=3364862 RepID=UPI003699FAC9
MGQFRSALIEPFVSAVRQGKPSSGLTDPTAFLVGGPNFPPTRNAPPTEPSHDQHREHTGPPG